MRKNTKKTACVFTKIARAKGYKSTADVTLADMHELIRNARK